MPGDNNFTVQSDLIALRSVDSNDGTIGDQRGHRTAPYAQTNCGRGIRAPIAGCRHHAFDRRAVKYRRTISYFAVRCGCDLEKRDSYELRQLRFLMPAPRAGDLVVP